MGVIRGGLDELKRNLNSLPNIKRNITEVINVRELKKEIDKVTERELRRRISK